MLLPYYHNELLEAGLDEAGRGALAGPVVSAAVILPKDFYHPLLNDSKQVSPRNRLLLREVLIEQALAFSVAFIEPEIIDRINILQACMKSMHEAIRTLSIKPQSLLIDGSYFKPYEGIKHHCIVGGDGKYASIAAASILAKTARDAYMQDLHRGHEMYHWHTNKGYGTKAHIQAIQHSGLSAYHRRSFVLKQSLF